MIPILLFFLILLLPAYSEAAYKIYLTNGSVITGVGSYEKRDGELILYVGGGSFGIPEGDILKIEETGAPEKDFRAKEVPEAGEMKTLPYEEPAVAEKRARIKELRADLQAINAELKTVEEDEASLAASLEEKKMASRQRARYNIFQLRQLDREIGALQEELFTIQKKKGELLQRKAFIEGELRALE